MKKLILFFSLLVVASVASAQVMVYVEAPSSNEGSYEFTYAQGTTWGVGDLTDPLEAVQGNMVMVDAGGTADSLACASLVNGAQITGNIAVLYRGSCEFGTKALNAQNAGAIGVIIINNAGGAPLEMGAGADGATVTVPVVMITQAAGALLKAEIEAGTSTVFIGSKNGLYGDDLSIQRSEALRAPSFGVVQELAQNGSEFFFEVGSWVRNYGTNAQTGVQLNCSVDLGVTSIYDETSTAVDIPAGDSVFISLPTFTQTSYANGLYEMTYSIVMGTTDESDFDNTWEANFFINDSLFSHATIDPITYEPVSSYAQFTGETGDGGYMETCIHFRDTNASRMGVHGMTFSGFTSQNPDPTSLDGKYVDFFMYTWDDNLDSISHWPTAAEWESVTLGNPPVASQSYIYIDDIQGENVFVKFDNTPLLVDNQRYLFCLKTDAGMFPGYDNTVDYSLNMAYYDQPINMVQTDAEIRWYPAGLGNDKQPAMTLKLYPLAEVGIMEKAPQETLTAFPNPANEFVTVLLKESHENVIATIVTLEGKVASTQNVSMEANKLVLDVTTLATGTYVVKLQYDGEQQEEFKIAVTR
jgi:hypothetical protein